jgi:hypothetical protein
MILHREKLKDPINWLSFFLFYSLHTFILLLFGSSVICTQSINRLSKLKNDFSKVPEYKINIQTPAAFLYSNNEFTEKKIPFTNSFIRNKTPRRIPRWQLEGGSRKRASYSEILERRQRHTLQA